MLGKDWAKASISQIVTSDFKFNDLLTFLHEQYQPETEVAAAKNKTSRIPPTLYQSYGRKPQNVGKSSKSSSSRKWKMNPFGRDGKWLQCSWCGAEDHFVRDCPPGAAKKDVRFSLERGGSAVQICRDLGKTGK